MEFKNITKIPESIAIVMFQFVFEEPLLRPQYLSVAVLSLDCEHSHLNSSPSADSLPINFDIPENKNMVIKLVLFF